MIDSKIKFKILWFISKSFYSVKSIKLPIKKGFPGPSDKYWYGQYYLKINSTKSLIQSEFRYFEIQQIFYKSSRKFILRNNNYEKLSTKGKK